MVVVVVVSNMLDHQHRTVSIRNKANSWLKIYIHIYIFIYIHLCDKTKTKKKVIS